MEEQNIQLFKAGQHIDVRGVLTYFNDLDLQGIKRLYIIEHPDTSIVRAWQGHKRENKWFLVLNGAFNLLTVQPDNWDNPSTDLKPALNLLKATDVSILHVPGGHATGITALESDSRLLVFSDLSTEESQKDDFRFDKNLWYQW
ncbi:hypothetical protein MUY27_02570 [Mucilaginibacter sp. RS28]|uniref:dTDP-4-dehydrorhamnose 3,5-epimerase n=1 Tax=Mucilaginibacter straminoryzae TaxID=2932774 RepID=A0A9X2B8C6_9SPHI|nr:hypothetical protein [Mucilaginibacter straminoryzae]MCJ8208575.1 hypothetical protein [Mucilaginibacter straminoryzae]